MNMRWNNRRVAAASQLVCAVVLCFVVACPVHARGGSLASVVDRVQPMMVKIFGAGGLRGLESYQSGFTIRADGYILTAWSYVLDTDQVSVVLDDGRKFSADLVGADPRSEIAILKIDADGLPCFQLDQSVTLATGVRVLAFSNLYGVATGDEPTSVLHGVVSGVTQLSARRGAFQTSYDGTVYVLDAMSNNAGAAGGALTDIQGRLAGVLGKELRDSQTNIWLNYAIPMHELKSPIEDILAGRSLSSEDPGNLARAEQPASLDALGIVLVPNVLARTPPFVEQVRKGSPGERAGVRADDLIVFVSEQMVQSQDALVGELSTIDAVDNVKITVMRDQQLIEITIEP